MRFEGTVSHEGRFWIAEIPLGFDLEPFLQAQPGALRQQLHLAPDVPLVGIVARLVPIKGITKENQRAQFRAIEYLGEYEDGNVAVAEERLMSIEIAPTGEAKNG